MNSMATGKWSWSNRANTDVLNGNAWQIMAYHLRPLGKSTQRPFR